MLTELEENLFKFWENIGDFQLLQTFTFLLIELFGLVHSLSLPPPPKKIMGANGSYSIKINQI